MRVTALNFNYGFWMQSRGMSRARPLWPGLRSRHAKVMQSQAKAPAFGPIHTLAVEERDWIMMGVINLGSVLEYGNQHTVMASERVLHIYLLTSPLRVTSGFLWPKPALTATSSTRSSLQKSWGMCLLS